MDFETFKDKQFLIPRNKIISGKFLQGVKYLVLLKSSRSYNPKTVKHIFKIFGVQSETLSLINCTKISSLSKKKGGGESTAAADSDEKTS